MRILLWVLLVWSSATAEDKKPLTWQNGTLIDQSVTLEDAGCSGGVCGGTYHRTHYTIEAGSKVYIANRTGGRIDITVNQPVKFAVDGNTVYLTDAKGKVHNCHLEQERDAAKTPAPEAAQGRLTGQEADATIALVSAPAGADVNVDGDFVGNAPATLKLKPGKHTIKLTLAGYKDWSRDLNALPGSQVSLTAALDKTN
ncbi:MAG TPA: PEGA domain-containing protein [Candidatus Angelobacter sp.]|nr:PEGA domain-containing protein [Candidatus Angelobacter sp.]